MNNSGPQFNNFEKPTNMKEEKFDLEIAKYHELVEEINVVKNSKVESVVEKASLSFLIEETKKNNPDNWEEVIEDLKREVREANKKNGEVEVSWLLSDTVDKLYLNFLSNRIEEVEGETEKRKIRMIKKMVEDNIKFKETVKKEGKKISFGGVSFGYAPKWRENL